MSCPPELPARATHSPGCASASGCTAVLVAASQAPAFADHDPTSSIPLHIDAVTALVATTTALAAPESSVVTCSSNSVSVTPTYLIRRQRPGTLRHKSRRW